MQQVMVCDHPLIRQALGELRRKETPPLEFRARVGELARYLTYEAARDQPLVKSEIETPLAWTTVERVDERKIILAPILRAGLAMIDGAMAMRCLGFRLFVWRAGRLTAGAGKGWRRLNQQTGGGSLKIWFSLALAWSTASDLAVSVA